MARNHRTVNGLTALVVLSATGGASAGEPPANSMTVVYNHVSAESGADLIPAGGFSAAVRFNGQTILFDTGGERGPLSHNLQELKINPAQLDAIVISHNHWDHVYGLPGVAYAAGEDLPVYVPDSAQEGLRQQNPRANIVTVERAIGIAPGVWVVGPLKAQFRGIPFAEQALVLEGKDGLVVLVGCSHPGIVKIIEAVKKQFGGKKVDLVAGGLHLRNTPAPEVEAIASALRELGVARLAPSHCTGEQASEILGRHWPQAFLAFDLGDTLRF